MNVVVLTKDRPDLLGECLRNLRQSLDGMAPPRVWVWDNGTDAETPALCRELGARRLDGTGENLSFSRANNEAAKHFKGDIILLNNDAFVQPGCLGVMAQALRESRAGIVGAKLLYSNGTVQHHGVGFSRDYMPFHLGRGEPPDSPWASQSRTCPAVTFACVLIDRKLWDALKGLDEDFVFCYEDIDFCLRAREVGAIIGVARNAIATHLEAQTEGRHGYSLPAWKLFHRKWIQTGRIYAALGVWPAYIGRPPRDLMSDVDKSLEDAGAVQPK